MAQVLSSFSRAGDASDVFRISRAGDASVIEVPEKDQAGAHADSNGKPRMIQSFSWSLHVFWAN